ncbi:MAG: hypothetical protein NTV23_09165 [Propionibacteriales bacterium]|nr:hypothetical protein [Propionibacteriales bacterium]
MKNFAINTVGGVVLLVLLVLGTQGSLLFSGLAVGAAVGATLLVYLGPDRLGIGLLLLATLLAPVNALKLGAGGNVTYADFAYVLGIGLLIPKLLTSSSKMPRLYTIGVSILFVNAMVVSVLAADPVASLTGFVRVIYAVVLLPVVFHRLRLSRNLLNAFVWAYVIGHIASTIRGSLMTGLLGGGRAIGLTTHPNFFGLAGQLAFALCVFLFYRTPHQYRWIVVGAAGICGLSVIQSGSRASLLCVAITVLIWPLVERTAISSYVLISFAALAAVAVGLILQDPPKGSAFDRLQGGGSATASSQARELLLTNGLEQFWKNPIKGNGWVTDILEYHNVYLEVGIAGGVIAVLGFLYVIASLIKPLFDEPVPNRLAFMGVSYAVFAMLGPTLYDRVLWGALALTFALHHRPEDEVDESETRIRRSVEKPAAVAAPEPTRTGRLAR